MGVMVDGAWRREDGFPADASGRFTPPPSPLPNWHTPEGCAISLAAVLWFMGVDGWTFDPGPGVIADPIRHAQFLHQVYAAGDPAYTGRVTVPVLWDRKTGQIVNNESSEIIRMLNSAFDGVGAKPGDFYPVDLRPDIDALNARIYDSVNNGVYRAGFARSQSAYDEAVTS